MVTAPTPYRQFWAKTGSASSLQYKSVAHHSADVAATAYALQKSNPTRMAREMGLTGLAPDVHVALCALMAGLHDLGKISKSFQFKVRDLWPREVLGPCPEALPQSLSHWEATGLLLNATEVVEALGAAIGADGLDRLIVAAIAGHHGRAPMPAFVDAERYEAERHAEIGAACVAAAAELTRELVSVLAPETGGVRIKDPAGFSFALNGLTTLSDWIGSDAAYFPFADPRLPLADYWPLALAGAERAVRDKGLLPVKTVSRPTLERLTGGAASPRPMQVLAAELEVPGEPQIVIIEDGTGSGKTEAALLLAARMMAAGLGEGLFLAMPTMATANAMHGRLEQAMPGLFEGSATLVLAHGRAALARELARRNAQGDSDAAAWCDAWVTDSRKTALFASAGAGTIDQAFLSILPKKHLTLRQYALAGRILIVDEAHACDAYMGEELKVLVEMQARLGGSVIVLSATLTRRMRKDLVLAFAAGRGLHPRQRPALAAAIQSDAYPLLTTYGRTGGAVEHGVTGAPELSRSVGISTLGSREAVLDAVLAAAARGAAVAIVCNAVDPAIAGFEGLIARGADPERTHLFHARFAMGDRLAIERNVQVWFGRDSTAEGRRGRILVATQVIEQSLDVDFDVMFTDLAPADLIVQRAGRLWRHRRPERPVPAPVLTILTPDPGRVEKAHWLDATLGTAAFIYDMPGVMWRTARDLVRKGRLDTPEDLRPRIEAAYAAAADDLPELLRSGHERSLGKEYGRRTVAGHNTISPQEGYCELTAPSSDEEIGTRDGVPSLTVRVARYIDGTLEPVYGEVGDTLAWALSEVPVRVDWLSRYRVTGQQDTALAAAEQALRRQWPEFEQTIPIVAVDRAGDALGDYVRNLKYRSDIGLISVTAESGNV